MLKKRKKLGPIVFFIVLTVLTIIFSGLLHLFNVQGEYVTYSKVIS